MKAVKACTKFFPVNPRTRLSHWFRSAYNIVCGSCYSRPTRGRFEDPTFVVLAFPCGIHFSSPRCFWWVCNKVDIAAPRPLSSPIFSLSHFPPIRKRDDRSGRRIRRRAMLDLCSMRLWNSQASDSFRRPADSGLDSVQNTSCSP